MMQKPYTIALYLRLSLEDNNHRESESITNQRGLLKHFISSSDEFDECEVLEFIDDGYSGTNFNRPAVADMLNQVKNGKIDCIVVKDFSRFGRNHIEVGDYIEQIFPFLGVRFISINNNFDSKDHTKQAGSLDIAFINLINDYYSKDISKKVTSAKQAKMRKGDYMSTTALFGYRKMESNKNRLEIDPVAAEYVRKVFLLCLEGKTTGAIALEMNTQGIPTPMVYKRSIDYDRKWRNVNEINHWTRAMVLNLLRDERYIGSTVSGKTKVLKVGSNQRLKQSKNDWIVVPNTHEPIISQGVFSEAQIILGLKNERSTYRVMERLFAGKVKCGTCGHAMRGRYDRARPFFFCETTKIHKTECVTEKVYEDDLGELVLGLIRRFAEIALCADNIFVQLQTNANDDITKLVDDMASLQAEIDKVKSAKITLYESYKESKLTRDMYIKGKKQNEDVITTLQSRMEKMGSELKALKEEQNKNQFVDSFKTLVHLAELTPQLVRELVYDIKIHTVDDIAITWNFEDNYQRVVHLLDTETR